MIQRILLSLFITLFLLTTCRAGESELPSDPAILSMKVDAALSAAAAADSSLLDELGETGGEGAWFVLSSAADDAGYDEIARYARIRSAAEDTHPYGTRSLTALCLEDSRLLSRPLAALRKAERRYGSDDALRAARIAVLASEGRQRALLKEYESYRGEAAEAPVLALVLAQNPEDPNIRAIAERFVLHCPDPAALSVLADSADKLGGAGSDFLLEARIAYARGEAAAALEGYRKWIAASLAAGAPCDLEDVPPVFNEISRAAADAGRESEWAEYLSLTAREYGGAKRFGAAYQSGRLYRGLSEFGKSAEAFSLAADSRAAGLDRDRALWYRIRVLYQMPYLSTADEMEAWATVWSTREDLNRFDDLLEEFLHRRVLWGEWALLENLWRERGTRLPDIARARTALVLAFAAREGRLEFPLSVREYLEAAREAAPLTWAGLRAAGLLGTDLVIPLDSAGSGTVAMPTGGEEIPAGDRIITLYLRWGLVDLAADSVLAKPRSFEADTIRAVARALAEEKPRVSIRVAGLLWSRDGFVPTRSDLMLRHPLPYGNQAARAAEAEGLPPEIFRGLIRTESAWDAVAVSRSGAAGLTQFMPATWEEWVGRMRYPEDADPMDPTTNLALGAAYLDWLNDREWTFGWIDVLASYNAGGGRVRTWRREQPGYGDDLFGESIPVEEPRSYIRKVLSAATLYGYLYAGKSPGLLHEEWGLDMFEVK